MSCGPRSPRWRNSDAVDTCGWVDGRRRTGRRSTASTGARVLGWRMDLKRCSTCALIKTGLRFASQRSAAGDLSCVFPYR